ncbi:MAG: carboxypeptidase-like regulatory domain-containing protein [archaeon]
MDYRCDDPGEIAAINDMTGGIYDYVCQPGCWPASRPECYTSPGTLQCPDGICPTSGNGKAITYCGPNDDTDCGCDSCLNCNTDGGDAGDGYYVTGTSVPPLVVTDCVDQPQREEDYRNYYCSGFSCSYSVTVTRTVDNGDPICNEGLTLPSTNECYTGDICVNDGFWIREDPADCPREADPATPICTGGNGNCGRTSCIDCDTEAKNGGSEGDGCDGRFYVNYSCPGVCPGGSDPCIFDRTDCSVASGPGVCQCDCDGYNIPETPGNNNCFDGRDNDCDGDPDCADSGCSSACNEMCTNSVDDDADNDIDCQDSECPWPTGVIDPPPVECVTTICSGQTYMWGSLDNCAETNAECGCGNPEQCEDCDGQDGYYPNGATFWDREPVDKCTLVEKQPEIYRNYYCPQNYGGCVFGLGTTRDEPTGSTQDVADNTPCDDDDDTYTTNDHCKSGVCVGDPWCLGTDTNCGETQPCLDCNQADDPQVDEGSRRTVQGGQCDYELQGYYYAVDGSCLGLNQDCTTNDYNYRWESISSGLNDSSTPCNDSEDGTQNDRCNGVGTCIGDDICAATDIDCGDSSCENCNDRDGWITTNTRTEQSTQCSYNTIETRFYRDSTCTGQYGYCNDNDGTSQDNPLGSDDNNSNTPCNYGVSGTINDHCDGSGTCIAGGYLCTGDDDDCGTTSCTDCNNFGTGGGRTGDGCVSYDYINYRCTGVLGSCTYSTDSCADCSCDCGGYNAAERDSSANCGDGIDNDCDGNADCFDPDCTCNEICNNNVDDSDPDSDIDCQDSDCPDSCGACDSASCSGGPTYDWSCAPICSGANNNCGCGSCQDCDLQDGWYDSGPQYNNPTGQCTYEILQDQIYRNYYCDGTGCSYSTGSTQTVTISASENEPAGTSCDDSNPGTANDQCDGFGGCAGTSICQCTDNSCGITSCTNCDNQDGWSATGGTRNVDIGAACNFNVEREEDFTDYSCRGDCSDCDAGIVTNNRWVFDHVGFEPSGTNCDDLDAATENDQCDGSGNCAGTGICDGTSSSCGTTVCSDCNVQDGWTDTGLTQYIDIGQDCSYNIEKEQDFYDYYCSGTSCDSTITSNRWIFDTTGHEPSGTNCDDGLVGTTSDQCDGSGNCAGTDICGGSDVSCGVDSCLNCDGSDGCVDSSYREYQCTGQYGSCIYSNDQCSDCSCNCGGYDVPESDGNGNCGDSVDNDCDGNADCFDPDCTCSEICTNNADDDGDTDVDCQDNDCPNSCSSCESALCSGSPTYDWSCNLICSGANDQCGCATCQDCDAQDNWYDSGPQYYSGTTTCNYDILQDQTYRNYYCNGLSCAFLTGSTISNNEGSGFNASGTSCDDGFPLTENTECDGAGSCVEPLAGCTGADDSCGTTICSDCNLLDTWRDNGVTQNTSTGSCTYRVDKQQEYVDYYCSGTACQSTYTGSFQWVFDSNQNRPDGYGCSDGNSCTENDQCSSGLCGGTSILACINFDNCCPAACTFTNDNDCEPVECPEGQRLCPDNVCRASCVPEGPCNSDTICDSGESCACSDCYGEQDSCQTGLICDSVTQLCSTYGCPAGTTLCDDDICRASCPADPVCDGDSICDTGESCTCSDCWGEQDSCALGHICNGGTLLCEFIGCPTGTLRCGDSYCRADCTGVEPLCDGDTICESSESCTCSDCYGEQDNCEPGLVCRYTTETCGTRYCPIGTRLCADGTCQSDCGGGGDPSCNGNTICDNGESCTCSDCDGEQDSCEPGLVCNDGFNLCDDPSCAEGTTRCDDGSCRANCPADPVCDGDTICDFGESCTCSDCYGEQDGCDENLVCDSTTETCVYESCPIGTTRCSDGTCLADCSGGGGDPSCDLSTICDSDEGCTCSDCYGEQDSCVSGAICNSQTHLCDDPGCPEGTTRCDDGSCAADCSGGGGDPVCNSNTVCEHHEGCKCDDCYGEQDSCDPGLICDSVTELCVAQECAAGTTLCGDGVCRANCGGDPSACDKSGTCDQGEGCTCSDCDGEQDTCSIGLVCESGLCQVPVIPCIIHSVSITASCGADGCEEGETINIDADYSGICPATAYIQVDASGVGCDIQFTGGDMNGIYTACDAPHSCGSFTLSPVHPNCLGSSVSASAAALWRNGYPDTGEFVALLATPTGDFDFWDGCPEGTTLCVDGSCRVDCSGNGGDPTCDGNTYCDPGESCACSDCEGEQDSCQAGFICGTSGVCVVEGCPYGFTWCELSQRCELPGICGSNPGTCEDDPTATCNNGEGCECQDCDGDKDNCGTGLICDFSTTTCTYPECGLGDQNCDGICLPTCGNPVCDTDGVCEPEDGESCACHPDCDGNSTPCAGGFGCSADADVCQLIGCGVGQLWCGPLQQCTTPATCPYPPAQVYCDLTNPSCQPFESCDCPDCSGTPDHCGLGLICIGGSCQPTSGCPIGTDLCSDGSTCSSEPDCGGMGWRGCILTGDGCQAGEGCHCSDCSGVQNQGPCQPNHYCAVGIQDFYCATPIDRECIMYEDFNQFVTHREAEWENIMEEHGEDADEVIANTNDPTIGVGACHDTDGKRFYEAGTLVYDPGGQEMIFQDECAGNIVHEYFCEGSYWAIEEYTCEYGCEQGACYEPGGNGGSAATNSDIKNVCPTCIYEDDVVVDIEETEWADQYTYNTVTGKDEWYACAQDAGDIGFCYSRGINSYFDCVFNGVCYAYGDIADVDNDGVLERCDAWNETSEICDNGADDDTDLLIDDDDPDCDGFIKGNVFVEGNPLEAARVEVFNPYQAITNTTNVDGFYSVQVHSQTNNDVSSSKIGFVPQTNYGQYVTSKERVVMNFTLVPGAAECQSNCVLNGICEPTCNATNGCLFYNTDTKAACRGKAPGFRISLNDTHEVVCCGESEPRFKPPKVRPEVKVDADNVITIRKIVVIEGEVANMVITVFD